MNTNITAIDDTTLALMKIVERAVRPVRANTIRKRKIRDELLAHLTAIYDEELTRLDDPALAVAAAAKRFGDPTELTDELQQTVPRRERLENRLESWFGWHAPETATRWMLRMALQLGFLMLGMCLLVLVVAQRELGWSYSLLMAIRPVIAFAVVLPISIAVSGISYYKMRDHHFGVFGSQKSARLVWAWAALLAVVTIAVGFVFLGVSYMSRDPAMTAAFYPCIGAGIVWGIAVMIAARTFGAQEIRDAQWLLLNLDDPQLAD